MDQSLFEQIEELINQGKHKTAHGLINKLLKKGGHSPKEKVRLSVFLQTIGEPVRALKILGSEYTYAEMEELAPDELAVQARLAYMMHFVGAKYVCRRIFQNLEDIAKKRNLRLLSIEPHYYIQKGWYLITACDYQGAYDAFTATPKGQQYRYRLGLLGLAQALHGLGKSSEALKTAMETFDTALPEEHKLKGLARQTCAEIHLRDGHLKEAEAEIKLAEEYFKEEAHTKNYAYLKEVKGALYCMKHDYHHALKELKVGLALLNHPNTQPSTLIAQGYWLSQIPNHKLGVAMDITLRAHVSFSLHSFLLGKVANPDNPIPLPAWVQKQYQNRPFDSWFIHGQHIGPMEYQQCYKTRDLRWGRQPIIDLYSGLCQNVDGQNKIFHLTELEARALSAIIGCGAIGINQWSLIDFVYRQEFFDCQNGHERLKKVIAQLKKKGLPIRREDNYFFFDDIANYTVILPMNHRLRGVHQYLKVMGNNYSRSEIQSLLGVSAATAKLWLSNWIQDGLITGHGQGKATRYSFSPAAGKLAA